MSRVEEIIDYYIAWEEVAERVEYKKSTPFEKEQIRLKYDEDAKYFKNLGYDDNTALHADVIVSFWTIYKSLLNMDWILAGPSALQSIRYMTNTSVRSMT